MFSKNTLLLGILLLSFLLLLAGLAYFLYLHLIFPQLVPHHGSGERFNLNEANNYTSQIPWSAYARLHLTLQANNTVSLYVNDDYVGDCTNYDFAVEQGEQILVLLRSDSPVSGMFRAWQEIPMERQLSALTLLSLGIIGIGISIGVYRRKTARTRS